MTLLNIDLVLETLGIVAVRLDDDFIVREVSGNMLDIPLNTDMREYMPALYGLEEVFETADANMSMPFVQIGNARDEPIALTVRRDPETGVLWLFLRDVREESAMHRQLVQNHNSLSLAQVELVKARDAAQKADRAKTAFLANVSHELRTPLHVIIGGASILSKARNTPLEPDEVTDYAIDMHESGVLLLQLVDDLIDLSRSETGNLILYEERCDLCEIARAITTLCQDLPEARHTVLECQVPADPVWLFADARRIKQILLNLISNAVKAVANLNAAEVIVTLDPDMPSLTVADNGPGMTAEEVATARQPFGQPRAGVRGKGTGLGLSIVERLVSLHGGQVVIVTEPGKGLAATVSFDPERLLKSTSLSQNVS